MTRNLCALVVAALALAGVAAATTTGTPGVSSSTITIGSSGPLTGEAAAAAGVLKGADAYFKYVNSKGGVNGRSKRVVITDVVRNRTKLHSPQFRRIFVIIWNHKTKRNIAM